MGEGRIAAGRISGIQRRARSLCEACGEGINFRREVRTKRRVLCRACAGERYYESRANALGRLLVRVRDAQNRRFIKMLTQNLQPDRQLFLRLATRN